MMRGPTSIGGVDLAMRTKATVLALVLIASPVIAGASNGVSLSQTAAAAGYTMHWLGPERSVSLNRDGIVVVLRPGTVLYDVNTHEEIADAAPIVTTGGDLEISARLASRLRALAKQTALTNDAPGLVYRVVEAPARGTIAMDARQMTGRAALSVDGSAPRNARITLTLLATLAPDLPTVLLQRNDVQADVNGRFSAVVALGPDYHAGSTVTLVATADGAPPATVRMVLDGPH